MRSAASGELGLPATQSTYSASMSGGGLRYGGALLAVFGASLFVSALLLFSLQPMFTKMVLPLLGGTPAVWSVAMVFFQGFLLLGYVYAHVLMRLVDPRRAVIIHLVLLALAFATLPIGVAAGFGKPPSDYAAFWLIGLFAVSIGLPFFAISANAPMLQAWFARSRHPQAHDPYFLYGSSNLGSFFALLAYPFLLEPFLTLKEQARLWSAGFVLLAVLIVASGVLLAWNRNDATRSGTDAAVPSAWSDRLRWMALAFVPSALLIAVTSRISTDIAAAPFLWVLPLALFLGTFILTFRAGGDRLHQWLVRLQPYLVAPLVIGLMSGERAYWLVAILLNLSVFVIATMICHRELYLRRPDARHVTEFYMWISLGGVLGGISTGLIAPLIFPDVWEYPILIVLALLCRPDAFTGGARPWIKYGTILAGTLLVALAPRLLFGWNLPVEASLFWLIGLVCIAGFMMLAARDMARYVALTIGVLVLTAFYHPGFVQMETVRSFFGVHKVVETNDGRFRVLFHGTTIHGAQRLRDNAGAPPAGKPEPLTYFYFGSPIGEAIASQRAVKGRLERVAVIGLGTGSLACHSQRGESWTYYEIDPVVIALAQDRSKFRFLAECAPQAPIVLGDARLTMADTPAGLDLIVLDAFSSDVVPVHLITREAMGVYLDKLAPGGAIVFHVSNRYLELATVVGEVAATHGLVAYVKRDSTNDAEKQEQMLYSNSLVVTVARRTEDVAVLASLPGWAHYTADRSIRPWTDDYSNILSAIWRQQMAKQPAD